MVQAVLVELPLFNGKMAFGFLLEAGESFKLYKFVFKLIWEGSEAWVQVQLQEYPRYQNMNANISSGEWCHICKQSGNILYTLNDP